MEDQKFWNLKLRSVCLKVLRNAVLLRYHALESVHGAWRTKQNKIWNFDMVDIAVREEENKERTMSKLEILFCFVLRAPWTDSRAW